MRRRVVTVIGLLSASCTLAPEDNFNPGVGGNAAIDGAGTDGSTGSVPDPEPGQASMASSDEGTSTTTDGIPTDPTDTTAEPGGSSGSSGELDPTGDELSCTVDVLDASSPGSTAGQSNATSGSCGGEQAPDQAFAFTAPQDGTFTFSTDGSDFDTVVYVLDGDDCSGAELGCDDDGGDSTQSRVTVPLSAGQTVAVVVDGYDDSSGAFVLTTSAQTADGCAPSDIAGPLPLTDGGATSGASATEGSCGGETAPEIAFAWTAPQAGSYTIHTTGSDFDTILYIRDGSCVGDELACDDDGGPSTQSSVTLELAAGQDIVIFADGYSSNSGSVVLTIES